MLGKGGSASDGMGGIGSGMLNAGRLKSILNPSDGRAGSGGSERLGIGGIGIGIESEGREKSIENPRLGNAGRGGRDRLGIGGIGSGMASAGRGGRSHIQHVSTGPRISLEKRSP